MRYRVCSGPRGSAVPSPLDKERMLFKEYDSLDAALGWARHVAAGDRVALLLEGNDGTWLGKEESPPLCDMLRQRSSTTC